MGVSSFEFRFTFWGPGFMVGSQGVWFCVEVPNLGHMSYSSG